MHIRPALALAALLALPSPGATLTVDPLVPVPRPGAPVPCEMRISGLAAGELLEGRLGFQDDRRNLVVTGPEWVLQGPEPVRGFLLPPVSFDAPLTPVWLPAGKDAGTRLRGAPLAFKGEFNGRPPLLAAVLHDHDRDLIPARRFAARLTPKPFRTGIDMTPVPVSVEHAPRLPLGWTAYDLVVAPASALEALSSEQLDALRAWIRAGGRLVLPAASWSRLAWDARPEPDAPISWLGFGRVWLHDWGNGETAPPEDHATAFLPLETLESAAKPPRFTTPMETLLLTPGRVISTGGLLILAALIVGWIALERRLFSRSRHKAWVWVSLPLFCVALTTALVLTLNVINPAKAAEKSLVIHDVSPEGWITRSITLRHVLSGRSLDVAEASARGLLVALDPAADGVGGTGPQVRQTGFPGEGHELQCHLGPWSHAWFSRIEIPPQPQPFDPAGLERMGVTDDNFRMAGGNYHYVSPAEQSAKNVYLRRPLARPGPELVVTAGTDRNYYNTLPPEYLPLPFSLGKDNVRMWKKEKDGVTTLYRVIQKLE